MKKYNLKNDKIGIIIQARCGSKRYPAKVEKKILYNDTAIDFVIKRLSKYFDEDSIILATTKLKMDEKLIKYQRKYGIKFYQGSQNNLISRYYNCANKYNLKLIVRLTADCPLVDPKIIIKFLNFFKKNNFVYLSNCAPYERRTYPIGSDVEIFSFSALKKYKIKKITNFQREHISPFFLDNFRKTYLFKNKNDYSNFRYTLDYKKDLILIKKIIKNFKNPYTVNFKTINEFLSKNKKLREINHEYISKYYESKIKKGY